MNHPFVDYYEVLQLSQTANADTVERVYRLLAKRYHPDNRETGDVDNAALLIGQDAGLIHDIPSAGEIVERLVAEAEVLLKDRLPKLVRPG